MFGKESQPATALMKSAFFDDPDESDVKPTAAQGAHLAFAGRSLESWRDPVERQSDRRFSGRRG